MKHYEEEIRKRSYVVKTTCDRCTKEVEEERPTGYNHPRAGEINEFTLKSTIGENDPYDGSSGSGEDIDADFCFECRKWLFDLLKREGVNLPIRKWQY